MIIGIDNALKGGIAAITKHHGMLVRATPMPVLTRIHDWSRARKRIVGGTKRNITEVATSNEIDAQAVVRWIQMVTDRRPCQVLIEECPEHAQQKSVMRSMAMSYGILLGALSAALPEYELRVVRSGNPLDSWQRAMLGKCAKNGTKDAAVACAAALWPGEDFKASTRSIVPHDGMIDAALIAEFGRRASK